MGCVVAMQKLMSFHLQNTAARDFPFTGKLGLRRQKLSISCCRMVASSRGNDLLGALSASSVVGGAT